MLDLEERRVLEHPEAVPAGEDDHDVTGDELPRRDERPIVVVDVHLAPARTDDQDLRRPDERSLEWHVNVTLHLSVLRVDDEPDLHRQRIVGDEVRSIRVEPLSDDQGEQAAGRLDFFDLRPWLIRRLSRLAGDAQHVYAITSCRREAIVGQWASKSSLSAKRRFASAECQSRRARIRDNASGISSKELRFSPNSYSRSRSA